ncbi:hypothetical protein PAHAL_5G100300 [Panicum hallii]|jgi:hypothetical protein|uniref:Uncharacterized protein n=1 Tax=Panicum hallii TaxID=206008 RepID=A0A2T8IJH4_9POAL|nr:hypothetical protein PAHAL_5G100300 [Panicum hallii]
MTSLYFEDKDQEACANKDLYAAMKNCLFAIIICEQPSKIVTELTNVSIRYNLTLTYGLRTHQGYKIVAVQTCLMEPVKSFSRYHY